MLKSGIIIGVVALFLGVGIALLVPLCVPCMALLLGIVAGFLAGVFDKPPAGNETIKTGALAGVIGGIGLASGQIIGAVINSMIMDPEDAARLLESLGIPVGSTANVGAGYWVGVASSTLCFGFLDIILMAGLGALGALAWGQFLRKNDRSHPEVMELS